MWWTTYLRGQAVLRRICRLGQAPQNMTPSGRKWMPRLLAIRARILLHQKPTPESLACPSKRPLLLSDRSPGINPQNLAEGAARGSWSKLQAMGHFLGRHRDLGGAGERPKDSTLVLIDAVQSSPTFLKPMGEIRLGIGHHKAGFSMKRPRLAVSNISDCSNVVSIYDYENPLDFKLVKT